MDVTEQQQNPLTLSYTYGHLQQKLPPPPTQTECEQLLTPTPPSHATCIFGSL